ncbi:response regulator transcription factor [Neorhizobium sp. T25_27]|uniref:response regulator transcription factor n=1 Tax=Neorhizobium sp. T25_27 TaxID=2093831 RepID=UPI000CF972E1|nr:response regulator [Neorhizobium sp. T25_27]
MSARKKAIVAVVDDDKHLRESLQDLLEAEGFVTHLYASAEDFLSKFESIPADCILADVKMTGMSGIDMLRILRTKVGCPPVLIMTSYGDTRMQTIAFSAGAMAFLSKPLDSRDLISCIKRAVS